MQNNGESLHQWSDRVLTLATRAFPQLPDVRAQAIPRLCFGAEDKDAGMYALDGQPKTVEEAVDRIQFYQHSRQFCSLLPKHELVRTVTLEEDQAKCVEERKSNRELLELQNRVQDLEKALLRRSSVRASPRSLESQGAVGEEGELMTCFKCGEAGHFRQNYPNSAPQSGAGIPAVDESRPPWNGRPFSSGSSYRTADRDGEKCVQ